MESGTLLPKINQQENLIAFWSYDQDVDFFCLFELTDSLEIKLVETFFEDSQNMAWDFAFNGDEFAVPFPGRLKYYKFLNGQMEQLWQMDASKYGLSYPDFISPNYMIAGAGKRLYFINVQGQRIAGEIIVEIEATIEALFLDPAKENLLISTNSELKLLRLEEINWLRPGTA